VDFVSQWILKFLDSRLTSTGSAVVYSEFTHGFVRARELDSAVVAGGSAISNNVQSQNNNQFSAEFWLDEVEIDALARVLGRRGIRAIARNLQAFVGDLIGKTKKWLSEDESNLSAFKRVSIPGDVGAIRYAKSTKNTDLVVAALRSIGASVKCGQMLRDALTRAGAPFGTLDNFPYEADLLADIDSAPMLWSNVSHAVAASLCATDFWKGSDFINRLDAHSNNAHLIATGACAILKKTQEPKQLRMREMEFLASFTTVLMEMKRDQTSEYKDWPLRGATLFLEKIVRESSTLTSRDLDAFVPFPIRHAAILDRSLGRVHGYEPGMGPDEFAKRVLENERMFAEDEIAEQVEDAGSRKPS
jgi:hypothetical protein